MEALVRTQGSVMGLKIDIERCGLVAFQTVWLCISEMRRHWYVTKDQQLE